MKLNKKILIITPTFLPAYHIGGPIFQIIKLIDNLKNKNIEPCVITTNRSLDKNKKKYKNVIYLKYFFGRLYFSPTLIFLLIKKIVKYDNIYIVSCFNFFSLFTAIICIIFNKNYFLSPRGSLMNESVNLKNRFIKKLWILIFEKIIIDNAKKVIFSSEYEKKETFKIIKLNNYSIIPNFQTMNVKNLRNLKKKNENYLLYIGRITKKKNIDKLILAYDAKNNFKIKIIGSGDHEYIKYINELILKKNLSNKIKVLRPVYNEKKKINLFLKARFSILISDTENFGNTILESITCKTPVIISKKTAFSNLIYKERLGVKCVNTDEDLKNIFKKINLGFDIRINNEKQKKIIKKFNDNRLIEKYLSLFDITKK